LLSLQANANTGVLRFTTPVEDLERAFVSAESEEVVIEHIYNKYPDSLSSIHTPETASDGDLYARASGADGPNLFLNLIKSITCQN
jgi:hypothetical protein